jgi:hypothetical protein
MEKQKKETKRRRKQSQKKMLKVLPPCQVSLLKNSPDALLTARRTTIWLLLTMRGMSLSEKWIGLRLMRARLEVLIKS